MSHLPHLTRRELEADKDLIEPKLPNITDHRSRSSYAEEAAEKVARRHNRRTAARRVPATQPLLGRGVHCDAGNGTGLAADETMMLNA